MQFNTQIVVLKTQTYQHDSLQCIHGAQGTSPDQSSHSCLLLHCRSTWARPGAQRRRATWCGDVILTRVRVAEQDFVWIFNFFEQRLAQQFMHMRTSSCWKSVQQKQNKGITLICILSHKSYNICNKNTMHKSVSAGAINDKINNIGHKLLVPPSFNHPQLSLYT